MTTPARQFKDSVYDQLARVGQALAAPKRLELLELLSQGPRTVEALAEQAALSLANASRHLQVLKAARLVDRDKRGLYVTYRLAGPQVAQLYVQLRNLGHDRLAEVQQAAQRYFADRDGIEPIDPHELRQRLGRAAVTLIDVRPREEYDAGHIAGALSVPLPQLDAHLRELPRDRQVVAYCRGPYCVMAAEAVQRLRASGYAAQRLEGGVWDWPDLPVAGADPRQGDGPAS